MTIIAVILKGYPRLSETFVAQELLELERAGFKLHLYSMRYPTDKKTHPVHDEITAGITYLPEYLYREPGRVFRAWIKVRKSPGYAGALKEWLLDLRRDFTPNRARRFGQAIVLAAELSEDAAWLYGHFIHTPGSVTRYTHLITALPWSCSAHAKDIWTSLDWELREKLDSAEWTATCTGSGHRRLQNLALSPGNVHLIHHGLDLDRFPPPEVDHSRRDGAAPDDPFRIVTVGRAVEKKGLDTLIEALSRLPDDLNWRWTHIGGGVLSNALKAQTEKLGVSRSVTFLGSQPQTEVIARYRSSDLFVLPCRIAADGDRDGLPNVLVEAASQELACISTPISGIVELLVDGENGILVEPDNVSDLATAIETLCRNPRLRQRLGKAAAKRVREEFDNKRTIRKLTGLFCDSGIASGSKADAS